MAFGDISLLGSLGQSNAGASLTVSCSAPTSGRLVVVLALLEWNAEPTGDVSVSASAIGVPSLTPLDSAVLFDFGCAAWVGVVSGTPGSGNVVLTPDGSDTFDDCVVHVIEVDADTVVQSAANMIATGTAENPVSANFDQATGESNLVVAAFGAHGGNYDAVLAEGWTELSDVPASFDCVQEVHYVLGESVSSVSTTWNNGTTNIHVSALALEFGQSGSPPIEGTGDLVAGPSSVAGSGSADTVISGTGALSAQAVALAGSGVVLNVRNLVLTQAQGRELRDENADPWELNGVIYQWYDDPDDTTGEPNDSGTFNTNENGEATVVLSNSTLTDGHVGGLILIHPSDPTIRGYYRVPVTLTQ